MRNHVRTVLWVSALATLSLTGSFPAARIAAQGGDRSDVLITFTDPPGPAEQALVRAAGGQIAHTYRLVPGMAASLPTQAAAALLKNPRIKAIEPDVRVFATDVELTSSWGVERIGAGLVHQTGNRGADVKIAIIDSGIDYTHPDLAANYAGGRDFVNNDDDPMDDNGHGTHVAGSAAARDNDSGVVGAAPEARLYAVKVLNENGTGSISTVIAALDWAVLHGMQVTNNSYGTSVDPGTLTKDAFDRAEAAGLLNIAAAGNEGNCAGTGDNVGYPARYSSVVAVAATTPDDLSPCFSSTGPAVELSAPGYEVNSTLPGETYGVHSGTSMASPHVAGTAALIITAGVVDANGNGRVNDEVRRILDCTARDLGTSGRDSWYGFGLVDAAAAVAATSIVPGCAFVSVTTDKTIYFSGVDTTGQLSVVVTDESGAGVAGLSPAAFATTLDGGSSVSPANNFRETAAATYSWSIDVPTALGPHTIVATVNYGDVSGGGSAVFDVVQPNLMHVPSINYSLDGGPKSSRNLRITVPVRDGAGAPIAQAAVSVVVRRNGTVHSTGTAITNLAGNSVFELRNAPSGRYQTQITGVNKTGMTWDQLTPPNEFIK